MVGGVLALGVLQAALTKAPYLLIKEVVDAFLPPSASQGQPNPLFESLMLAKKDLMGFLHLDSLLPGGPGGDLSSSAILLALMAVLGGATIFFYRYFSNLAASMLVVDLRNRLCSHLLRLSSRYFGQQRTGEMISRVSNDTNTIRHSFTLVFENAILEPLFLLFNAVLAFSVSPWMGWFLVVMIPVLGYPMTRFGRKVRKGSGKSLQAMGKATDAMSQMFLGFRTVKAYRLEDRELEEFEKINETFLRRTMKMVRAKAGSQALLYSTYMLGFAGLLYGLQFLPKLDLAEMGIGLAAIGTSYTHIKRTARTFNLLKESQGAFDRLQELMELRSEIVEKTGAREFHSLKDKIEFQKVSFAYEKEPVLKDLSFSIRKGQKIALVGPSGAGKSTILNLLGRFYDPDGEGRILVDGTALEEIQLASWLDHISIVDQNPFLFNRTIRENILLGKESASEEEWREAARMARVDEFAEKFPNGYETLVGEGGDSLSGGQKQRVTIARAILRDPELLLLDEATSALDTESEKAVQEALDVLMRGRTSVVIAHRLSTIRASDRILVLEKGRIVEEGSHQDLMEKGEGVYRKLTLLQEV
jgi:subfamily B ATP-binding cassette protein MsbA